MNFQIMLLFHFIGNENLPNIDFVVSISQCQFSSSVLEFEFLRCTSGAASFPLFSSLSLPLPAYFFLASSVVLVRAPSTTCACADGSGLPSYDNMGTLQTQPLSQLAVWPKSWIMPAYSYFSRFTFFSALATQVALWLSFSQEFPTPSRFQQEAWILAPAI